LSQFVCPTGGEAYITNTRGMMKRFGHSHRDHGGRSLSPTRMKQVPGAETGHVPFLKPRTPWLGSRTVRACPARLRGLVAFPIVKPVFVWGFCMGAQGA
jgi:hypothetical protein